MEVNGKLLLSVNIREVSGSVFLYTSPMRGYRPASGIIRAVRVREHDDSNYKHDSTSTAATIVTTTTTPTTTTTTTTRKPDELLWTDNHNHYFKVKITPGTNMVSGTVSRTCLANGMQALCSGNVGCHFNSAHCLMTSFANQRGCGGGGSEAGLRRWQYTGISLSNNADFLGIVRICRPRLEHLSGWQN